MKGGEKERRRMGRKVDRRGNEEGRKAWEKGKGGRKGKERKRMRYRE